MIPQCSLISSATSTSTISPLALSTVSHSSLYGFAFSFVLDYCPRHLLILPLLKENPLSKENHTLMLSKPFLIQQQDLFSFLGWGRKTTHLSSYRGLKIKLHNNKNQQNKYTREVKIQQAYYIETCFHNILQSRKS